MRRGWASVCERKEGDGKMKKYQMYINGQWVDAADGGTYADRSPYTGEMIGLVPAGGPSDARLAIDAAKAAFPAWAEFAG
jgi:acyl-CoA reductase-like NAD-dependent aldehyde dehydrogenase